MEEGGGVMDCNSYSYVNYAGTDTLIERFEADYHYVELTEEQNWFQDKYFTVRSDVEDEDGEWILKSFEYTLLPDTRGAALEKAKAFYDNVVNIIKKEANHVSGQ